MSDSSDFETDFLDNHIPKLREEITKNLKKEKLSKKRKRQKKIKKTHESDSLIDDLDISFEKPNYSPRSKKADTKTISTEWISDNEEIGEGDGDGSELMKKDEGKNFQLKFTFECALHKLPVNSKDRIGVVLDRIGDKLDVESGFLTLDLASTYDRAMTLNDLGIGIAKVVQVFKSDFNADKMKIKFQWGTRKAQTTIKIPKYKRIASLKETLMKEHDVLNGKKLTFWFDGEIVDEEETPESLEMEDGDCIDVKAV